MSRSTPPEPEEQLVAPRNVLGGPLQACSFDPLTGFRREGCCHAWPDDPGRHWLCARVTAEFLAHSLRRGNDLVTPRPQARFPGLRPGDRWCLCVARWLEAVQAGCAPPVVLDACHEAVLGLVSLEQLQAHAHRPLG